MRVFSDKDVKPYARTLNFHMCTRRICVPWYKLEVCFFEMEKF